MRRLADPSIQHRRVAPPAEIGKHWPELPVARKRAVLTTLIERIDIRVDRIDLRLRAPRLAALLDGPDTPPQGANGEVTELLSLPVRLRRFARGALYLCCRTAFIAARSLTTNNPILANTSRSSITRSDAVQARLASNAAQHNDGGKTRPPSLLVGMLFDGDGNRMMQSHAVK